MAHGRPFVLALGLSTALHLSMVTVFSIVIFFPREDYHYYSMHIVEPRATPLPGMPPAESRLRVPSMDDAPMGDELTEASDSLPLDPLPQIELPTIEFAELRRLRGRERGLELATRRESLLNPKPRDAWARFGEELGELGNVLSRLRLSKGRAPRREAGRPVPTTRPAAGFAGYVEWLTGRKDRQLLFAPPVEALWGMSPSDLEGPLVLEFTVNPQGRVVSVWSPHVDAGGLTTAAQNALLKYRFEPVDGDKKQQAVLHITAEATDQ